MGGDIGVAMRGVQYECRKVLVVGCGWDWRKLRVLGWEMQTSQQMIVAWW